jgi:hypothetical protein
VQLAVDVDAQIDVLVFGDRLVRITDLAQDLMQYDVAETRRTAAILDFREAQQRRDDRERAFADRRRYRYPRRRAR